MQDHTPIVLRWPVVGRRFAGSNVFREAMDPGMLEVRLPMIESRLPRVMLILGAAVGIGGIGVWALGVQIEVPDWMIRVAMLKLAFAGSLGLLAAGALIGRHARSTSLSAPASGALGEGTPDAALSDRREKEKVNGR